MVRLLFWIALIALAVWLWRHFKRRPAAPQAEPGAKPMVRCAHCGVHVPREHALQHGSHWFCCNAHQGQGPRDGGN